MKPVEVVVVGAGPVGLTLACELARRGVGFRLIDSALRPFEGSRGKTLQPRTLELMEDLGVIDQILARGEWTPAIRTYQQGSEITIEHLFGGRLPTPDTPYPRPFTIAQNLTEGILRSRLAELGGHIEYGVELVALEQTADELVLTYSTALGVEIQRASYLVGCDGGRSTVRDLLGVSFEGDTDETRRLYVADVRLSGLDRATWYSFRGPGGMLNIAPLPTTELFQIQAAIPPQAPDQPTMQHLQAIIEERAGSDSIRLLDMAWSTAWRLNVRLAARYRAGRVLLAGDAAHVHSPAGAQGLNTGVQDGYNLGWKIAGALRGAPAALLDSYEAERRPLAARMLGMTSALEARSFSMKGLPTDRDESMLQLNLNYRDSPLAREERAAPGRVVAGDRIPDATELIWNGKSAARLFDVLRGPRPTVMAIGEDWGEVLTTLRRHFTEAQVAITQVCPSGPVVDAEGRLQACLGITGTPLLVIRPDNYLGLATDRAEAAEIEAYLRCLVG
jgi:2-polyprenyl-6-methoxyphenol hydroxylase-like FAD-dependent oxidoreductase